MKIFGNTAIAFAGKTNRDLQRALMLFSILANPVLVRIGSSITYFMLKIGLPIKGLIRKTLYSQFVGGETIDACEPTIKFLSSYNIGTILDYSVEGKGEESDFESAFNEIMETIHRAGSDIRIPFSVFKISGIAPSPLLEKVSSGQNLSEEENQKWNKVKKRVNSLCEKASALNTPVFIDAEETWIQPAIDVLAENMMKKYNTVNAIVYHTIQLYRTDRLNYLKLLLEQAEKESFICAVKLVRGAYMEKERNYAAKHHLPDPIQPNKESSDQSFNSSLNLCLKNHKICWICVGTHNEFSTASVLAFMKDNNIEPNHKGVWFAQLLGMSDHISFNLSALGYNVAKYVPYGPVKEVFPYLSRRAMENTSVAGQTGRELALIREEIRRRHKESNAAKV
jgi:proline dehydrogenase